MQEERRNEQDTPMKRDHNEDRENTTAGQKERHDARQQEAHQERHEKSSVDDYERQLTEKEDIIESLGKKLRDLYFENLRLDKDDIEKRKHLQDERASLRKDLIDASHQHKLLIKSKEQQFKKKIEHEREDRQKELEEENRKLEAQREERRRAREDSLKKAQETRSSRKVEKETIHESHVMSEKKPEAQRNKEEKGGENPLFQEEKKEEPPVHRTSEQALSQSRYRLRLAEIESELTLESLRRSRRIALDCELASLRSRYSYYPYYPLYRYPLYSSFGYYGYYGYLY